MTIPATLTKLAVAIDSLHPYERNPRRGDLELLKASLDRHGQYRPIVVRKGTNEILAGNHTWLAAKALGWPKVAATLVEVDDDEAARIVLIDNRASDRADYDQDALRELLRSLPDVEGTGYDPGDINGLLDSLPEPGDAEVGEPDLMLWGVIVECETEFEQGQLLERFAGEGLNVKALMS